MPTKINRRNIDKYLHEYLKKVEEISLDLNISNNLVLFHKLKRQNVNYGPYPNVTIFEAANRIMTDLVILIGIKRLLNGIIKEINFDEYSVELGNGNLSSNDICAQKNEKNLIGEAFNVSPSFFQTKKSLELKKMRNKAKKNQQILLIYNSDAVNVNYKPRCQKNEFHLKVNLKLNEIKSTSYNKVQNVHTP